MAVEDYGYLSSLSAHPNRAGDTSYLNPAFAGPLANAIRQARAEGLNVGLESGFRAPGQTGSAYDAGGNSSHSYGLASDISGLDGPNGKLTQRWAQIAEANGLHNPYGVGNRAEFNHWQLPEQPLEKNPQLLASLKQASASGDTRNVWNAYNGSNAMASNSLVAATAASNGATPPPDNRAFFYDKLTNELGLSPKAAMGVIYSMGGESHIGLDTGAYNPNDPGGAFGAAQWTGPRQVALNTMAQHAGLSPNSKEAQWNYLKGELTGAPGAVDYSKVLTKLQDPNLSSADATRIWTTDFEAPKNADKIWQSRYAQGAQYASFDDKGAPVWKPPTAGGAAPTAVASNAPATGPPTSIGDALKRLTQKGEDDKPSAIGSLAEAIQPTTKQQQQQPQAPAMLQAPQDQSAMLAPAAQQLMAQTMATFAKPLSWSSSPYGSGMAGQQPPGLTLTGNPYNG